MLPTGFKYYLQPNWFVTYPNAKIFDIAGSHAYGIGHIIFYHLGLGPIMPDLSHLWAEPSPIPLHAIVALAALAIGTVQMVRSKGTSSHRIIGYIWVLLMLVTAVSAMFIHTINMWGKFSPIHILIPVTVLGLWQGVRAARRGDIQSHKSTMRNLFILAIIITGLFTLLPGRVMNAVFFGGT